MPTLEQARTTLAEAGVTFTRKEYMDNAVTYRGYMLQFVTADLVALVDGRIGRASILASTDEHFNDIPLGKWDALAPAVKDTRAALPTS